jgi:hypothetical protein
MYIIKSGNGYLIKYNCFSPHMTTDPLEATRMSLVEAHVIRNKLENCGWEANIVELVFARYRA